MRSNCHRSRRAPALVPAACLAACVLLACLLAGCGGSGGSIADTTGSRGFPARMTRATLVLDFMPSAVHAGIYRALAAGYYRERNLDLRVVAPSSTADSLKLVGTGKAQLGLADAIDVAIASEHVPDLRAILAIVQRPLGGVIALRDSAVSRPARLAGRTVGITGVPSDRAVLAQILRHDGVAPGAVKTVTIGFGGVSYLEHGKVAAFTGYWPIDAVQADLSGHPTRVFKLDRYGGPSYPGLVAFSSGATIHDRPGVLRAFVAGTVEGYRDTLRDPARSLADLSQANPGLDRRLARASLHALLPVFRAGATRYGVLRRAALAALSAWMVRSDLIAHPFDPDRLATNAFLPRESARTEPPP